MCGTEIVVSAATIVASDFDARFSAKSRRYRYFILNEPHADPLQRHLVWHFPEPLDVDSMNEAARHFLGLHDFASFCRRHPTRSSERNVLSADWGHDGDLLVFDITASSFCHQMVRSLVGTMVDVGRGQSRPTDMPGVIAARDRHEATLIAPPAGLCLWEVTY
jgi:tRNA pseudouridine38-40 synthase